MKFKILLPALFVCIVQFTHAQEAFYSLFAAEGTEWSVGQRSSDVSYTTVEEIYFLRLQGVETINGNTYHKISKIESFGGNEIQVMEYLRLSEDSILYVLDNQGTEEMIFDYTLGQGDTLVLNADFQVYRGSIMYVEPSLITPVVAVETTTVNGVEVNKWNILGLGDFTQSLGSFSNMLDVFQSMTGYSTSLLCVYHNGKLIYDNPDIESCNSISAVPQVSAQSNVSVYPNPTNGNFLIKGVKNNTPYCLYNALGVVAKSGVYSGNPIDVTNLHNGVYYLKVESKTYQCIIKR